LLDEKDEGETEIKGILRGNNFPLVILEHWNFKEIPMVKGKFFFG